MRVSWEVIIDTRRIEDEGFFNVWQERTRVCSLKVFFFFYKILMNILSILNKKFSKLLLSLFFQIFNWRFESAQFEFSQWMFLQEINLKFWGRSLKINEGRTFCPEIGKKRKEELLPLHISARSPLPIFPLLIRAPFLY